MCWKRLDLLRLVACVLLDFMNVMNVHMYSCHCVYVLSATHSLSYTFVRDESSEPVYTEFASKRSNSLNSINSIESTYDDEESLELKQFADKFVNNIFSE